MPSQNHFQEQLASLASAFSVHLQHQAKVLMHESKQIQPGQTNHTISLQLIRDIAHDLHSQGLLFGFVEISKAAGLLEHLTIQMLRAGNSCSSQTYEEFQEYINAIINATNEDPQHLFDDDPSITAIGDHKNSRSQGNKPKQILLIEDAAILRHRISISLMQAGYEVLEAPDGLAGVEMAYKIIPDLILLDLYLPGLDGFEVQKKIKTNDDLFNVPLIFLTSLSRVSIAQIQTALSYGVTDYISKPFIMSNLLEKIKTNLA